MLTNIYIGPYINFSGDITLLEHRENICVNTDCSNHDKEMPKFYRFCPMCGGDTMRVVDEKRTHDQELARIMLRLASADPVDQYTSTFFRVPYARKQNILVVNCEYDNHDGFAAQHIDTIDDDGGSNGVICKPMNIKLDIKPSDHIAAFGNNFNVQFIMDIASRHPNLKSEIHYGVIGWEP